MHQLVLKSLNHAHKIALKNEVMGIINCPINKKLLIRKKIVLLSIYQENVK